MKKALYGFFVLLGLIGGFAFGSLNAAAQEALQTLELNEIRTLPGYKSYSTLSSFTKHLQSDPTLYKALSSNQKLSEKIMGSTSLQRQLLTDIKKAGDSQQVVSGYLDEFNNTGDLTGTAFSQREDAFKNRMEQQRQQRKELNRQTITGDNNIQQGSQRIGGNVSGNANLAAQRAIERAQRQKEAADRQAVEALEQARLAIEKDTEQAKFQAEMLQFKKIQDMVAQLASEPGAIDAFFADTKMIQKLMDDEMTVAQALEKLGVKPDPSSPSPKDDTIFGDGFEEPAPSENGLVHVSGNHYKLNGMDVWDMNHIPDPAEMALDANGWPKYLNVPNECPPPRENTEYFHEAYMNYNGGDDPDHPLFGKNKHSLGDMSFRLPSYFNHATWYYTSHKVGKPQEGVKSQETAYPFVTPNKIGNTFGVRVSALNYARPSEVQSISYCPGDFSGVTPANEPALLEGCQGGVGIMGPKHVSAQVAYEGDTTARTSCELQPGKRYFHNFRPMREHKAILDGVDLTKEEAPGEWGENSGRTGQDSMTPRNFMEQKPPYANSCASGEGKGDGAFPMNYPQERLSVGNLVCGREVTYQNGCTTRAHRTVCYDVTGQMAPVTFQQECFGNNLVWTKGFGEKALSNYVCERFKLNGELDSGSPHYAKPACAAHREGEVLKNNVVFPGTNYRVVYARQCQFDEDLGRYDWHLVSHKGERTSDSFRNYVNRPIDPPNGAPTFDPPAHKNTCAWDGEEYPLGTKMVQTRSDGAFNQYREGTHTYVCAQRAPAPALPRFSHVDLHVSPVHQTSMYPDKFSVEFK